VRQTVRPGSQYDIQLKVYYVSQRTIHLNSFPPISYYSAVYPQLYIILFYFAPKRIQWDFKRIKIILLRRINSPTSEKTRFSVIIIIFCFDITTSTRHAQITFFFETIIVLQ